MIFALPFRSWLSECHAFLWPALPFVVLSGSYSISNLTRWTPLGLVIGASVPRRLHSSVHYSALVWYYTVISLPRTAHSCINKSTSRTINAFWCFHAKNLCSVAYNFAKLFLFGLTYYKRGISLLAYFFFWKFWAIMLSHLMTREGQNNVVRKPAVRIKLEPRTHGVTYTRLNIVTLPTSLLPSNFPLGVINDVVSCTACIQSIAFFFFLGRGSASHLQFGEGGCPLLSQGKSAQI